MDKLATEKIEKDVESEAKRFVGKSEDKLSDKESLDLALGQLNEQISELQNQAKLIGSIDFSKPVDEDTWHKICETPLRNSNLLAVLVKNIFPLAENITVHCNYVYFDMLGFKVQIPTSRRRGINVDTSWYEKDWGEPTLVYSEPIRKMIEYFDAVDNKKGWYECARRRLIYGDHCSRWVLFVAWWFKYKWKDPKRKLFEETKKQQEKSYMERVERYRYRRKNILKKTEKLFNELLPILDKFSTKHYKYNDGWGCSIEDIRKNEEL